MLLWQLYSCMNNICILYVFQVGLDRIKFVIFFRYWSTRLHHTIYVIVIHHQNDQYDHFPALSCVYKVLIKNGNIDLVSFSSNQCICIADTKQILA